MDPLTINLMKGLMIVLAGPVCLLVLFLWDLRTDAEYDRQVEKRIDSLEKLYTDRQKTARRVEG